MADVEIGFSFGRGRNRVAFHVDRHAYNGYPRGGTNIGVAVNTRPIAGAVYVGGGGGYERYQRGWGGGTVTLPNGRHYNPRLEETRAMEYARTAGYSGPGAYYGNNERANSSLPYVQAQAYSQADYNANLRSQGLQVGERAYSTLPSVQDQEYNRVYQNQLAQNNGRPLSTERQRLADRDRIRNEQIAAQLAAQQANPQPLPRNSIPPEYRGNTPDITQSYGKQRDYQKVYDEARNSVINVKVAELMKKPDAQKMDAELAANLEKRLDNLKQIENVQKDPFINSARAWLSAKKEYDTNSNPAAEQKMLEARGQLNHFAAGGEEKASEDAREACRYAQYLETDKGSMNGQQIADMNRKIDFYATRSVAAVAIDDPQGKGLNRYTAAAVQLVQANRANDGAKIDAAKTRLVKLGEGINEAPKTLSQPVPELKAGIVPATPNQQVVAQNEQQNQQQPPIAGRLPNEEPKQTVADKVEGMKQVNARVNEAAVLAMRSKIYESLGYNQQSGEFARQALAKVSGIEDEANRLDPEAVKKNPVLSAASNLDAKAKAYTAAQDKTAAEKDVKAAFDDLPRNYLHENSYVDLKEQAKVTSKDAAKAAADYANARAGGQTNPEDLKKLAWKAQLAAAVATNIGDLAGVPQGTDKNLDASRNLVAQVRENNLNGQQNQANVDTSLTELAQLGGAKIDPQQKTEQQLVTKNANREAHVVLEASNRPTPGVNEFGQSHRMDR